MTRSLKHLRRLAQELAALTPEDRARVLSEAMLRDRLRPPSRDFTPPLLSGGTRWIGGDLRRQRLFGED